MPSAAIWGTEDQIIPVSHVQNLPENVVSTVVSAAGHMVHMEAAAAVNKFIMAFWKQSLNVD